MRARLQVAIRVAAMICDFCHPG